MKKTIKALTAVLVVATLCLGLLAGCAGGSIVGRWKATAAKMGDSEMSLADMASFGVTGTMEMEFKADGTVDGYTDGAFEGTLNYTDNGNGTYTVNGQILRLEGGRLFMDAGFADISLIFTKQ